MAPAGISVAVLAEALPGPAAMTFWTSKYLCTPPAKGESAVPCVGRCWHWTLEDLARRCTQLVWLGVSENLIEHLKPDRFGEKSVAGSCGAQEPQLGVAPAPDASCRPLQGGQEQLVRQVMDDIALNGTH